MPTIKWLQKEFNYGYDSGDILSPVPNETRAREEAVIGGSYREVFDKALAAHLREDSKVMELGPGRGSWSRAMLKSFPGIELHTLDFQDVCPWLQPNLYNGRLVCHRISDNSFSQVPDGYFDFFWSFGVLCHCNAALIETILKNALAKLKPGGLSVHQFGDWQKLEKFGWERGAIPRGFRDLPDDQIWWPRNTQRIMARMAEGAGWEVVAPDMGLVERDSIIVLRRP